MDHEAYDTIRAVAWHEDRLRLLDQRVLPERESYLDYDDPDSVGMAIRDMVVRGAPAIGVTAAYGVVLAVRRRHAADQRRILMSDQSQSRTSTHWPHFRSVS